MSKYFNNYSHSSSLQLNSIIEQSDDAITYAVGQLGLDGFFSLCSGEGNMLISKSYELEGEIITFIRGIQDVSGDFVIFGTKNKGGDVDSIVIRISSAGDLVWSYYYYQNDVVEHIDMIYLSTREYVFLTRINKSDKDTFEIVKINDSGNVVADFQLNVSNNYTPTGLTVSASGFLVYGTVDLDNWDSFYIHFGNNLSVLSKSRVGNSRYQLTRDALHIGGDKFVVTGEHHTDRRSFIYEFSFGPSSFTSNIYDICESTGDEGFKKIKVLDANSHKFLLTAQNSSSNQAYECIFNSGYTMDTRKKIVQSENYAIRDLMIHTSGNNRVRSCGFFDVNANEGLLLSTDATLELCCIQDSALPSKTTESYTVKNIEVTGVSPRRRETSLKLIPAVNEIYRKELCPITAIDLSGTHMFQSPYLYMQSAGSDGVDGTVKGFHLRWDFKGVLGKKHLAKGNLSGAYGAYPATHGFNKSDDFTKIYRTPFVNNYYTKLDLQSQPSSYNVGGSVREWHYNGLNPQGVSSPTAANVIVSFPDTVLYDAQAASAPPNSSTVNFLKGYTGEIQVKMEGKLSFRVEWTFGFVNPSNLSNAVFRHEALSLSDSSDITSQVLKDRHKFTQPDFAGSTITVCEDIYMLRFDRTNAYPTNINLYAYSDYIQGVNQNLAWTKLSESSLTLDETEAFRRLENTGVFTINNKWPKFNEDDSGTGKFKVSTSNYQNRWTNSNGLSFGVDKYLTLSQSPTNEQAIETVAPDPVGQLADNSTQDLNYFTLLGIASLDYHVSRMLGLGHIDANSGASTTDEYIYIAEYTTEGDLEDGLGVRTVKHLYMTPHQNILDFKLPPVPEMEDPISYGLAIDNGTPNPSMLTNHEGYTPFADIRFVNINRHPMQFEKPLENFFQVDNEFSLSHSAQPIGFGVEYKDQGGTNVMPELNHDKVYSDNYGIAETNILPNTGNNPVFRHQETKEGIHCYQMYSVNWFSRASDVSPSICTTETVFPTRNTIVPPANLSVHLVQDEAPPLLSTSTEQIAYSNLTGDRTYLRTIFDWNYIHHQAYQFADKVQFFFNKQEKCITKGEISAISVLSGHRLELTTSPYSITSTSPTQAETVIPTIPDYLEPHFVGSLIGIGGQNYRVDEIINTSGPSGENPKIIIHQIKETNSIETVVGTNSWVTTENYLSPNVGDRFLIAENLGPGDNWDNHLQKSIYLETFSTNDKLEISASTHNDGTYTINSVNYSSPNTVIEVHESLIDSINDGNIHVNFRFPSKGFTTGNDGLLIEGNVSAYFSTINDIKLIGAILNDGSYTKSSVTFNGTDTEVKLNEPLDLVSWVGYLVIEASIPVADYNSVGNIITISGDYSTLIIPSYKEIRQNTDGTSTTLVIGGLTANCSIVEELDVYSEDDTFYGTPGDPILGSRTGVYTFTFTGNPLPPHIDPEVSWFRGKVRVLEDDSFLPTQYDSRTTARMKVLDVENVGIDEWGNLVLIVNDPTFQITRDLSSGTPFQPIAEYVPIITGISVEVNYHPSYHLYLTVDETQIPIGGYNAFNEASILPAFGEGSRKTFLGIRAVDTTEADLQTGYLVSRISVPAAINAMEIREPQQPDAPLGLLYATRPDFYGKSTYTIDVGFQNIPYSVLVYKADERKILDTLYLPETANQIVEDLAALGEDLNFSDRWNELVNGVYDTNNLFNSFGGYAFPIPDNTTYEIPLSTTSGNPVFPFNGSNEPGSETIVFEEVGVYSITMRKVVKEAIESAFVSQTEEPMIYAHLQTELITGGQTSNAEPTFRNSNGDRIAPGALGYNAHPNAIKLTNGKVRFTDYKIDGGTIGHYFYYAMEYSDRQKKSPASAIIGPIVTINTRPAKQVNIKKIITQIENVSQSIPTAVCFKIEDYIPSEKISRIGIYRAIDPLDAITIRTMDLGAEIDIIDTIPNTEICDTFEGLDFPLFGEDLYYRLVAFRKIKLEDGSFEFIPSEPSKLVSTTIVDPNNPSAPCIVSENGTTTATELQNVVLKWDQVCYNGTYSLQKMNDSGNWQEIYKIKSNDDVIQYPPLVGGSPDFINFDATAILPREDENGTPIYHRFRVQVENSSGLFNLSDCPLTLATGCFDLQVLENYINYEDGHGFSTSDFSTQEIDDGVNNNPNEMTFEVNLPNLLPAGHNAFDELEIKVTDDLANTFTKTISSIPGSVTFVDGEGGLQLNAANRVYTVTSKLTTDLCTTGFRKIATISYVHGPCNDLSQITQIVEVTDNTNTYTLTNPTTNIDDGVDTPVFLTFTDISNVAGLTIPQTFTQIEITVSDELGNSHTKTITTAGGNTTFNDGDGGLVLNNGTLNRSYQVALALTTVECTVGKEALYSLNYTYNPCNAIQELTDIVSFTDNSSASINPLETGNINFGVNNPGGSITLTDIVSSALPVGHTFDSMLVTIFDGAGGFHSLPILSGSSATFNTGNGDPETELNLGASNPNPIIGIEVKLYTDLCSNGASFYYNLSYNYDPYVDLGEQTDVVSYLDGNGLSKSPLNTSPFNDGTNNNPGGTMTFTELVSSNLPAGDTFGSMNITVQDGSGGEYTASINTISGSVIITNGQGGLVLNASQPNKTYTFIIEVITTLCPEGVVFVYSGRYKFGV